MRSLSLDRVNTARYVKYKRGTFDRKASKTSGRTESCDIKQHREEDDGKKDTCDRR